MSASARRFHRRIASFVRVIGAIYFLVGFVLILAQSSGGSGPFGAPSADEIERAEVERVIEELSRKYPEKFPPQHGSSELPPDSSAGLAALGVAFMFSGGLMVWWGRRRAWPVFQNLNELREELDGLRFTLYLRPFATDQEADPEDQKRPASRQLGTTAEEAVTTAFHAHGPVVAIGKPGEAFPMLGAYRLYVHGREWRKVVVELGGEAQLIVVRVGTSPGLSEELDLILAGGLLSRTVFLLPPRDHAQAYAFMALLGERLHISLHFPKPMHSLATLFVVDQGRLVWFYGNSSGFSKPVREAVAFMKLPSPAGETLPSRRFARLFGAAATTFGCIAAGSIGLGIVAFLVGSYSLLTAHPVEKQAQGMLEWLLPIAVGCFILALILFFTGGKDPDAR